MNWEIHSFNDLIKHNVDFLKGIYKSSPYHAAPVYDVNDNKLIFINSNGIVTIDGQSNICEYNEYLPTTRHIYYTNDEMVKEDISVPSYYSVEQKSYISGFIQSSILDKLVNYLNKLDDVYYVFSVDNTNKLVTNIEYNIFYWLTRVCDSKKKLTTKNIKWENISHVNINKFENIFRGYKLPDTVYFIIFVNNIPCKYDVQDVLVNFIKDVLNNL